MARLINTRYLPLPKHANLKQKYVQCHLFSTFTKITLLLQVYNLFINRDFMKQALFLLFFFLVSNQINGQLEDGFLDGDFDNNPTNLRTKKK